MTSSFSDILNKYTQQKLINPRKSAQAFQGLANQGSFAAAFSAGFLNYRADQADAQESVLAAAVQGQKLELDERRVAAQEVTSNANALNAEANAAKTTKETGQLDSILKLRQVVDYARANNLNAGTAEQELQTALNTRFGGLERVAGLENIGSQIKSRDTATFGAGLNNQITSKTLDSTVGAKNASNGAIQSTAQPLADISVTRGNLQNAGIAIGNTAAGQAVDFTTATQPLAINAANATSGATIQTALPLAEEAVTGAQLNNGILKNNLTFSADTLSGRTSSTNATNRGITNTAEKAAGFRLGSLANKVLNGSNAVKLGGINVGTATQTQEGTIKATNSKNNATAVQAAPLAEAQTQQAQAQASSAGVKAKQDAAVEPSQTSLQITTNEESEKTVAELTQIQLRNKTAQAEANESTADVLVATGTARIETAESKATLAKVEAKYADTVANENVYGKKAATAISIYRAKNDASFQKQVIEAQTATQQLNAVNSYVKNTLAVAAAENKEEAQQYDQIGKRITAYNSLEQLEEQRNKLRTQVDQIINKKDEFSISDVITGGTWGSFMFPSGGLSVSERADAISKGQKAMRAIDFKIDLLEKMAGQSGNDQGLLSKSQALTK